MSVVSNVIVSSNYMDQSTRDALATRYWVDVGQHAGGTKVYEADLYAKAFNHTANDTIVAEVVECICRPDDCLLVIHHEYDEYDEMHLWVVSSRTGQPVATPLDHRAAAVPQDPEEGRA